MKTPIARHPGRVPLFAALLLLEACSASSPTGIVRYRAQDPPIAEGLRKVRIAVEADGYMALDSAGRGYAVETDWRALTEGEQGEQERGGSGTAEGRVSVRLFPRGRLYDVEAALATRNAAAGDTTVRVPDGSHPLTRKWQRILRTLLTPEERSED